MSDYDEIIEESYTQGLADWAESNIAPDIGLEQASQVLQEYAFQNELPIPDARGLTISDAFTKLINFIRNRRLVEDLGTYSTSFHWLEFHIPRGGKGAISWTKTSGHIEGMTLKVFGFGLGGGATLKLSRTLDFKDCLACQDIVQHLQVRVRQFETKSAIGDPIVETTVDPVRWLHREPREREQCCPQELEKIDRFKYEILNDRTIDTRKTTAIIGDKRELEIKLDFHSSVKLDLPISTEVGVELKVSGALKCTTEWEFPPGNLYVPYVARAHKEVLPRWSVSSGSN